MRIQTWHEEKLRTSADYANAHAEISLSEWLADLIVDRRVARNLTQTQLAESAGTTQATISQLENGQGNPRLDTLGRILAALHVSTREAWDSILAASFAETSAIIATVHPVSEPEVLAISTVASPTTEFTPAEDDEWQTAGVWSQRLAAAA